MQAKSLLLALACLLLFSATGNAQQDFESMRQTHFGQQRLKENLKNTLRTIWDGRAIYLIALESEMIPGLPEAWHISNDQLQQMKSAHHDILQELPENPEFQKLAEEQMTLHDPHDPFLSNADAETISRYLDIGNRQTALIMNPLFDAVDNVLTPEQKQKINETLLTTMNVMPNFSPMMFDALHLTDAQKQEMERIKKELEPEFEENLEYFASRQLVLLNKAHDELEKQGGMGDGSELVEKMIAIEKKLQAEDEEFKRISDEVQSQSRAFSTKFRTKMFDVLDDEQWMRLLALLDNPPEHAKVLLEFVKGQSGESAGSGGWSPGPGSWQPGDAIPERYRRERNTRGSFPRPTSPNGVGH